MRAIALILFVGLLSTICYAQTSVSTYDEQNVFIQKGDYYFDKDEFKKAIVYYNLAFEKDGNYYSVLRKAEAYTALRMIDQAAESYRVVFESGLKIPNKYRLEYALLLLENKNIKGFEKWLAEYNENVNRQIYDYVSNTDVRAKMFYDSNLVVVENEMILNSPHSEIAPAIYQDRVLFASDRNNILGSNGSGDYNFFVARYLESGQLGKLNNFNRSLQSGQDESSLFIQEQTNQLYLTRGTPEQGKINTHVADISGGIDGSLDFNAFHIDGFDNIGHPVLNSDGSNMYFVSEAPGGSGGLDIYSAERVGNSWQNTRNLGPTINTSQDEMYPFVLNDTILYFSSAGHNSLGGLDLYSVNLNQSNSKPVNLGSKVNTEYDDYGLVFTQNGLTGYFSSNRPGGIGNEDIYRIHLLDLKIRYPAYQFKPKPFLEDDKINLYLSDGEEYNITSQDGSGFDFIFQPKEPYKMVIQHENPLALNTLRNDKLSPGQREKQFLNPNPIEQTDIPLQAGMKYQFTAGMKPISDVYKSALHDMAGEYQNANSSKIDLTALAKELFLAEGEVYTIQFVKDRRKTSDSKSKEESKLIINDQSVQVGGRSFFIMLPLDIEANFNIQTDIDHFKETFNPRKVGAVKVDTAPVIEKEPEKEWEGYPILVNTESLKDIRKKISVKEFMIIPGTYYILTLTKSYPGTDEEVEIVVPLTKGVKYNLGTQSQSDQEYQQALSEMAAGQSTDSEEELIDISVLSKELNILPEDSVLFTLIPAKKMGSQTSEAKYVVSTLDVDGRKYYVPNTQKMQVKLKFEGDQKVNIQTDLDHVKENFAPSTYAFTVDTTDFRANISEKEKDIITDPVFDVIVVNFDINEYAIRPDAESILDKDVIAELQNDDRLYVTIKGYTDGLGNAAYNEKLSGDRARAVKNYLTENGIGEDRIRTFSYGESLSLEEGVDWDDLSEEELQEHRKVEIVIYLPE